MIPQQDWSSLPFSHLDVLANEGWENTEIVDILGKRPRSPSPSPNQLPNKSPRMDVDCLLSPQWIGEEQNPLVFNQNPDEFADNVVVEPQIPQIDSAVVNTISQLNQAVDKIFPYWEEALRQQAIESTKKSKEAKILPSEFDETLLAPPQDVIDIHSLQAQAADRELYETIQNTDFSILPDKGYSVLITAIEFAQEKWIKILLDKGVSPLYKPDSSLISPLLMASRKASSFSKLLLSRVPDVQPNEPTAFKSKTQQMLFFQAIHNGDEELVDILKAKGADINVRITSAVQQALWEKGGYTFYLSAQPPLFYAVTHLPRMAIKLLDSGASVVNPDTNEHAFYRAIKEGLCGCADIFIQRKLIDLKTDINMGVIFLGLIEQGKYVEAEYLLSKGLDTRQFFLPGTDVRVSDEVHRIANSKKDDALFQLCNRYGINVNATFRAKMISLVQTLGPRAKKMSHAMTKAIKEQLDYYIKCKVDIDCQNEAGETLLYEVIKACQGITSSLRKELHLNLAIQLLDVKANPNIVNNTNILPLYNAISLEDPVLVGALLTHGSLVRQEEKDLAAKGKGAEAKEIINLINKLTK